MDLGAFSISLSVADLEASRRFYEVLGFEVVGGDAGEGWLMLANGTTLIGLFHGMFEGNVLTFNPGLTNHRAQLESFTDVRDLQAAVEAAGIEPHERADPDGDGPAHFLVVDPDGNPVLVDQFSPRPT
jgi:catechol 2,3-dioxygenase-like lactoylglutathione lyase family enzyme